jgi:lysophospholipase L1-like esterase
VEKALVFVAFGDSLTVGYQSPKLGDELPRPTPYTEFLEERIEKIPGFGTAGAPKVEFLNRGVVGELTEDMLDRFDRDVVRVEPDFVIILGGSNDLGWGVEPQPVAGNLVEMYREAIRHGIRPIACTVPSILGFDEGIPPRLVLNQLIKKYSAEHGQVCVDLFTATCDSTTGRLREECSSDGLHMNTRGYETMAEAIFSEAVRGILSGHQMGGASSLSGSRHGG